MPVNQKINTQIHTMRDAVSFELYRSYTIVGVSELTGKRVTRTFADYHSMEQWLASYEATVLEIISVS